MKTWSVRLGTNVRIAVVTVLDKRLDGGIDMRQTLLSFGAAIILLVVAFLPTMVNAIRRSNLQRAVQDVHSTSSLSDTCERSVIARAQARDWAG